MSPIASEQLLRKDLNDFPPYSMGHTPFAELDRVVKLERSNLDADKRG